MRYLRVIFVLALFSQAMATEGFTVLKSSHSVKETADRFESMIKQKGMTLFIRIDHSANASKVDYDLRPTELLIFGNPKVGGPLMNSKQTIGIDLPFKALIWEDEKGQVWFGYNEPGYLAKRHGVKENHLSIQKATEALANFAQQATTP